MRKIAVFSMFLIILCLCSCKGGTSLPMEDASVKDSATQEESIGDSLLRSIEGEYERDSKKDEYITTVGMVDLAYRYADKWSDVSSEYREKIIALAEDLFPDKKTVFVEKLDKLSVLYDEYAESNLEVHKELYNLKYSGGSIIGPLCATEYYELKKAYALELVEFYEKLAFNALQ